MKLPSTEYINELPAIKQPRWHDRTVLIANHKLGEHNIIRFSEAPTLKGAFYVSGQTAKKYPLEDLKLKRSKNGDSTRTMKVRAVPLDELVVYEGRE